MQRLIVRESVLSDFYRATKKMVTIVTKHLSDPVCFPSHPSVGPLVSCRRANYKSLLFASLSVNDKVTIRWLTEDGWKGSKQSFERRRLEPESPELLLAGQKVDALKLSFIRIYSSTNCRSRVGLSTLLSLFPYHHPLVGNSSCPYMDVKCKTTNYITNLTRVRVTKETKSRQHCKNL